MMNNWLGVLLTTMQSMPMHIDETKSDSHLEKLQTDRSIPGCTERLVSIHCTICLEKHEKLMLNVSGQT